MQILLHRDENGENAKVEGVSKEKNFPGEEKKRERYRATFVPHKSQCRGTVCPPKETERDIAGGKEVPQEDEKGHEPLRIDMGWGIYNVRPGPLEMTEERLQTTTRDDAGAGWSGARDDGEPLLVVDGHRRRRRGLP